MKTATVNIDVLSVTKSKDIYTVQYWDMECESENFQTIQINEDSLIEHIEQNGLNLETFINYKMQNLECDGLDERTTNPADYLAENTDSVIKDYITQNS